MFDEVEEENEAYEVVERSSGIHSSVLVYSSSTTTMVYILF